MFPNDYDEDRWRDCLDEQNITTEVWITDGTYLEDCDLEEGMGVVLMKTTFCDTKLSPILQFHCLEQTSVLITLCMVRSFGDTTESGPHWPRDDTIRNS